jgi:hypothetical protein
MEGAGVYAVVHIDNFLSRKNANCLKVLCSKQDWNAVAFEAAYTKTAMAFFTPQHAR